MMLAAIRVKDGQIVDKAGYSEAVSITKTDEGFILHGAKGPAPTGWVQSPENAIIGWTQVNDGIHIVSDYTEPTIRFVPDIEKATDENEDSSKDFPEPDWSRVISVENAKTHIKYGLLLKMLKETDYVALADYDKEKPDVIEQRAEWRAEVRELEKLLAIKDEEQS